MAKFLSRKFLLAFFTGLFIVLNEGLGWNISKDTYNYLVGLVIAYIAANSAVAYGKK